MLTNNIAMQSWCALETLNRRGHFFIILYLLADIACKIWLKDRDDSTLQIGLNLFGW
jgi:hypothetical protein